MLLEKKIIVKNIFFNYLHNTSKQLTLPKMLSIQNGAVNIKIRNELSITLILSFNNTHGIHSKFCLNQNQQLEDGRDQVINTPCIVIPMYSF